MTPVPTPALVVLQARMESQRFYGKVLADWCGQPMLLWELARLRHLQTPHELVVACPDTPPNMAIADLCARHGTRCILVPGDSNDVLGRFAKVAWQFTETDYPTHDVYQYLVRLCGDTPFLDPRIVDGVLQQHLAHRPPPDHTGIALEWGDGFDCEVLRKGTLLVADDEAALPSDREHVTPYIFKQPERFRLATYRCPFELSWLRLSIDAPDDLTRLEPLFAACLLRGGLDFSWLDVWQVLEARPAMKAWMQAKPHNPAYVHQVAQEQGWPGLPEWSELRYGSGS